jgi:hypothetical protein
VPEDASPTGSEPNYLLLTGAQNVICCQPGKFEISSGVNVEPAVARFWVAVVLTVGLIVVLAAILFLKPHLTASQQQILRLLCALAGGFAGGVFTGEALAQFEVGFGVGGKLLASGTAGFALFMIVWLTYKAIAPRDDRIAFSVTDGWTFSGTAEKLAESEQRLATFEGFSDTELATPLKAKQLIHSSTAAALMALRLLTKSRDFPLYSVEPAEGVYILRRK